MTKIETRTDKYHLSMAKGGVIIFIGTLVGGFMGFVLHIVLSRSLGAEKYGLYSLGLSIFIIAHTVLLLGLRNGILRFAAIHKGQNDIGRLRGVILFSLILVTILSIFVCGILYFSADFLANFLFGKPKLASVLRVFFATLPFYNIAMLCCYAIQAFQKMLPYIALRNIFQPAVNLIIVAALVLTGLQLTDALYAFLVTAVLLAVSGLYGLSRVFPKLISDVTPIIQVRQLLRYSIPVLFIGVCYILLSSIDKVMLGSLSTSSNVGIYSIAAKVAIQIKIVLSCVNAAFAPIIADLNNKGHFDQIESLFKTSTRWIFTLVLPLNVICTLFSKEIMAIFGSEFAGGWLVLVILATAYLVAAMTGSVGVMLNMSGKQDIELINTVSMVGLNIVLNIWLIKAYGIAGAAIATSISITLINIIKLVEVKIFLNIQPYDHKYLKPLCAGLVVLIIYVLILSRIVSPSKLWFLKPAIMIVIYFGGLVLFGFEKEDILIFESVKTRFQLAREK